MKSRKQRLREVKTRLADVVRLVPRPRQEATAEAAQTPREAAEVIDLPVTRVRQRSTRKDIRQVHDYEVSHPTERTPSCWDNCT